MRILIVVLCLLGIMVFSFFIGRNIPFHSQKELLEPLLGIAGIVFGVLGIWLGILYPDLISNASKFESSSEGRQINKEANDIIFPFVFSLLLLIVFIVLLYLEPVLKSFGFSENCVPCFRGVSFSVISFITFCWIYSIFKLLAFSGRLKGRVSLDCAKRQLKHGRRSNGFKVERKEDL